MFNRVVEFLDELKISRLWPEHLTEHFIIMWKWMEPRRRSIRKNFARSLQRKWKTWHLLRPCHYSWRYGIEWNSHGDLSHRRNFVKKVSGLKSNGTIIVNDNDCFWFRNRKSKGQTLIVGPESKIHHWFGDMKQKCKPNTISFIINDEHGAKANVTWVQSQNMNITSYHTSARQQKSVF